MIYKNGLRVVLSTHVPLNFIRKFSININIFYKAKGKDFFDLKIPDNAPTSTENTVWLESLAKQAKMDELYGQNEEQYTGGTSSEPMSSYTIREKSDLETRKNNDLFAYYNKNKDLVRVIRTPKSAENPYFTLSVPATDYFIASSPFSSLPNRRRPKSDTQQSFSDLKVVKLRSGKGGDGNVAFFRDAGIAVGPPDGGDGGDGGNIYVMASAELSSLHGIRTKYVAQDGKNGEGGQLDGKKGGDIYITVPVGTHIRWCPDPKEIRTLRKVQEDKVFHIKAVGEGIKDGIPKYIQLFRNSYGTGEGWVFKDKDEDYHNSREYFTELNEKIKVYDKEREYDELTTDVFPIDGLDFSKPTKEPVMLLKGGRGGMGNMHFLTSEIRNPRFAKVGRKGLEGNFIFELKLLADLGLVGLPNAGKSTLLRAISNARPRVGHWEFTTLQPSIGSISLRIDQAPFTVADIPGIIKGASDNKGMGLNFLRHVERSSGLVFVVSLGSENPIDDLNVLLEELGPKRLKGKKILIVATKADLENSFEKFNDLREYVSKNDWKCVPCCPMKKENIETVIELMAECCDRV
ncbi:hypothetical protein B5S31_g2472 [[Candida] boidinii]|nr:hypothetical protein B5S29_g2279 [[Candida] boidinii]OWB72751.1 hypothetical protein B5S31_g2472 [[Candida] boidinii]